MIMSEQWWLSPYNNVADVAKELTSLPKQVKFYDTTLRDGEQSIGVSIAKEDKIEIAKALDEAGVDRIEAGFPSSTVEDKEAVIEIVKQVKKAEVWGFARCNVNDVKTCVETGVKAVNCEISTSPEKMKAWQLTEETVLTRIRGAVKAAKEHGLYCAFFAVDASRADLRFLKQAYDVAVKECGADEVVLVDTLGVATPEAMFYLTTQVKSWVKVPVAVHCHNDFGLASACSIAALKAGADSVHVTVNGLGEKSGNADIADMALALTGLYGLKTNVKLDHLYPLSKLVAKLTKVPVSPLKSVVGDTVWVKETGSVVAQLMVYPPAVEGYSPELVGRKRDVYLSKKSGKKSIEYALNQIGKTVPADKIEDLLTEVKLLGAKNRGVVTLNEFRDLVQEVK
jgi:isopropylmalate/homocitrate/citramalate synthase